MPSSAKAKIVGKEVVEEITEVEEAQPEGEEESEGETESEDKKGKYHIKNEH